MRLSTGSAAVLGIIDIEQDSVPTTCYIMLGDKCENHCAFCSQNVTGQHLSRINWIETDEKIIEKINASDFKRVCLQCTSIGIDDVKKIANRIRKPFSISYNFKNMGEIKKIKAEKICIPLDAANESIYSETKIGSFEDKIGLIQKASTLKPGKISTHLIAGLGENLDDMEKILTYLYSIDVDVGIFAFTRIPGSRMDKSEPPELEYYRKVQAMHYRIKHKTDKVPSVAFETSGCIDCNRPYYNERPTGPIYNYPRPLTDEEYDEAMALVNS